MTNLPVVGYFKVTCPYHKEGKNWIAGHHTGIDITNDNHAVYSTCDGTVYKVVEGNKDYGNYIIILDGDGYFHYFCHLLAIKVKTGNIVSRVTLIGTMGSTGKSTGTHLHYEIRNKSNKYDDTINPAEYMGIPNQVGNYISDDFKINNPNIPKLKTLCRSTNLRNSPTIKSTEKRLYLPGTTLYVMKENVSNSDGYIWDEVKIRINGKVGYMINKNYK